MANKQTSNQQYAEESLTFMQRLPEITRGAWDIVTSVLLYVIIGIYIEPLCMHMFQSSSLPISEVALLIVPLAVILAVPMYANAAELFLLFRYLWLKGVLLRTAIAFMMANVDRPFLKQLT